MMRLYAVLDADNVKINTIVTDEDAVNAGWYPGYGAALVDEGELPPDPPKPVPPQKPETWQVYPELAKPMAVGDKLDLKTMQVNAAAANAIADVG